jgi:hypothetical protein
LFGDRGFSKVTLSQTLNYWNQYVVNSDGKRYTNVSTEIERTLKAEATYQPSKSLEFNAGGHLKSIPFDLDIYADGDTVYEWNTKVRPPRIIKPFIAYPVYERISRTTATKAAAFGQVKWHPVTRLTATLGLRFDAFAYTKKQTLDPRLGFSYALTEKTGLNLAFGRHSQAPPIIQLTAHPDNSDLDYKKTTQVVFGLDRLFREDIRGTIEVFYKDYKDVPVSSSELTDNPYDFSEGRLVNRGKGYAKGIEFFLQKKMSHKTHYTLSYSYSISRGYDPRYGTAFDWDFDFRHVFTAIYGVQWNLRDKDWYRRLGKKTWYRCIGWLLPLADQVEAAVRWRYLGGRPYSALIYHPELQGWYLDAGTPLNGIRYPAYHRLDFRLDRRYMFNGWNLVTYFDIMNIYSRDNIWSYQYYGDGTKESILQYKVFPVGGVTVEF